MSAPTAEVEPNEAGDGLIVRVFDTPGMEPMILALPVDWSKAILSALMEHFQPEPGDPSVDLVDWSHGQVWQLPDRDAQLRAAEEARDGAQFALAIAEEKIQGLDRALADATDAVRMLVETVGHERTTVALERRRVAAGDEQLQQVAAQYNQLLDQLRAAQEAQEILPEPGMCLHQSPEGLGGEFQSPHICRGRTGHPGEHSDGAQSWE